LTEALLVHDIGPGVGMGHKRRMEALAVALGAFGVTARVAAIAESNRAPLVFVDSYRWRADDGERFVGAYVAAVDELERGLDIDLVVDPTPGASPRGATSFRCLLAGSRFALVDPNLLTLEPRRVGKRVSTVLITTGATDTAGHGAAVAEAVSRLLPATTVQLVVGPWSGGAVPPGIEIIERSDGLGSELAAADLVVTAGGVTMLEALCLGRPTIAIITAANQRRAVSGAARAGAVEQATIDEAPGVVERMVDDPGRRQALSAAARTLVDGRGAMRVARKLVASMTAIQ
jgi:UDP-2,4-diacetamido-2,4,6-trideoxy-beta-L-altropyranose hydrolase